MKKTFGALLLALCVLLLAGCSHVGDIVSGIANQGEFPVTIGDVTVNSKPSKGVVLSPSLAEVVLALGYETQLVAVGNDCEQTALSSLTRVNGADISVIDALGADLILLESSQQDEAQAFRNAGMTVLCVDPATDREDFERLYGDVAMAFAGNSGYDAGVEVARGIFTTLDDINRIVPKDKITTGCYLYNLDGSGVTGDQLASTVMGYAGVTNIFKSLTGGVYDFDSLRYSNPDVIFCAPGLKDAILNDERFSAFRAVTGGKVFELEEDLVNFQGRTIVTLAYQISANTFPELLESEAASGTDPIESIDSQVASAMATPTPTPVPYNTLTREDESDEVLRMQDRLSELGYLTEEYDGYFGEVTENCVKAFQQANGLEATGIADNATLQKLYSEEAVPAQAVPTQAVPAGEQGEESAGDDQQ